MLDLLPETRKPGSVRFSAFMKIGKTTKTQEESLIDQKYLLTKRTQLQKRFHLLQCIIYFHCTFPCPNAVSAEREVQISAIMMLK